MPDTFNYLNAGSESFTIPTNVAYIDVSIWAGGGGGEDTTDLGARSAGTAGGQSSIFGLTCEGGRGGGVSDLVYAIASVHRYRNDTTNDFFCTLNTTGAPSPDYVDEGELCKVFVLAAQPPSTIAIIDDEDGDQNNAGKPYSGSLGYAYPSNFNPSNAPVATTPVYAFTNAGQGGGGITTGQAIGDISQNPKCQAGITYGWYTRSGGPQNSGTSGVRNLLIFWNGSLVYEGSYSGLGYQDVNGYRYTPSTKRGGSPYGWYVDDVTCGTANNPNGDHCNSFDVTREYVLADTMWTLNSNGEGAYISSVPGTNANNILFYAPNVQYQESALTSNGGAGGTATDTFGWANYGVSVSLYNGTDATDAGKSNTEIGDNTAGLGATIGGQRRGDGGIGDPGSATYVSTSNHIFDNANDIHIVTDSSDDINIGYRGATTENLPCSTTGGKYYTVRFVDPYVDNTYSITHSNLANQAAAGGPGSFTVANIRNKNRFGYDVWFCRNNNGTLRNSYIRSFTATTTGIKEGRVGMGGGGGGGAEITLTRDNFIDSIVYAPGTTHPLVVGGGGDRGASSGASDGGDGRITLFVVYRPVVTFTTDGGGFITVGSCVRINWIVSGDADTITWTSGGIDNGNLASYADVCPQETTTYTAVGSGLGGTGDPSSVTITVYGFPTAELDVPVAIDYGTESINVEYTAQYADASVTLFVYYGYINGTYQQESIDLPVCESPENNSGAESISTGIYEFTPTWDDQGPRTIQFRLEVQGAGGSDTAPQNENTVVVNIDETPDNFIIPASDDLFKEQEPVLSPDTEILSELIQVDGIDIPVEIRANYPVLVDLNQQGQFAQVRDVNSPNAPTDAGRLDVEDDQPELKLASKSLEPIDTPLTGVKTQNAGTNYENLVTCISVIDESSPSISTHSSDWTNFRANYPQRSFYLLQPQGNNWNFSDLNRPNNFLNDSLANGNTRGGTFDVNRDDGSRGDPTTPSNWFNICDLNEVPPGAYVSLWVDISGSMTFSTIQQSYNQFVGACNAAGIDIVLETSDSGERWIPGHNKDLPPSGFIEVNPSAIKAGETTTVSWVAFGEVTSVSINKGVGNNLPLQGDETVTRNSDTTFTMTIIGPEGTVTRTAFLTVYEKPVINISASDTNITPGQCITISWNTTGDADAIAWTAGAIDNGNLNSSEYLCPGPEDTTTFTAVATGLGGTSDPTSITITVSQFPVISVSTPTSINYGATNTLTVEYDVSYANQTVGITVTAFYVDGTSAVVLTDSTLPTCGSAELNGTNSVLNNQTYDIPITWTDKGPSAIQVAMTGSGDGGNDNDSDTTSVIIDQTPDNFIIPDSDELIREQEPVDSPDTDILSELLLVDDIDIPVEIKANYPILVDVNQNDDFKQVRQI